MIKVLLIKSKFMLRLCIRTNLYMFKKGLFTEGEKILSISDHQSQSSKQLHTVCVHVSHDDANLLYKQVYPKQELIIIRRYEMCHIYWHIQFVFLGMIISFSILKHFSFHHSYYLTLSNVICCIVKSYLKLYKILYNLTHQILIVFS